ncbi:MAG: FAD-dependent oxidoreductase [Candidatus Babeliales bacterium]|jgi:protoporphyrinogen oxidase
MKTNAKKEALIIGSGPAGLTAALELARSEKLRVLVVEKENVVGGLAKTIEYKRCRFDIGPHHYLTESAKVLQWWRERMKDDFHMYKRFTRIYYKKKFFNYPLEPLNVIKGLSFAECLRCVASYLKVRIFPIRRVKSFQDWVTNKFGRRLYSMFFKTYTEKLWGIPCTTLSADWASQRIKGFSLFHAIFYAFFGRWFINKPRTIRDTFYYPSRGSGTLWEHAALELQNYDKARVLLRTEVVAIEHAEHEITAVWVRTISSAKGAASTLKHHGIDYLISSMPLRHFVLSMDPLPPEAVVNAAQALRYRGLIIINLIVNKVSICPDHWLYIHDKDVAMVRLDNMNNFSLRLVDDATTHTTLCLEYFAWPDDSEWKMADKDLVKRGAEELEKIGLAHASDVIDGTVVRVGEAYPVYDEGYDQHVQVVRSYLAQFRNLHLVGRNALHQYNNMDTAMLTAFDAVDKILAEQPQPVAQPSSLSSLT